jgi:hypothetical protein
MENFNGDGNVPDAAIFEQVNVLNRDFSGTGVSFYLAGIDRYVNYDWYHRAYVGTAQQVQMTSTLRRGGAGDLNIFSALLDQPPPGVPRLFGYATFPWDFQQYGSRDGVVLDLRVLPGGPLLPGYSTGKIGTHEVGHWVGLLHTFQTTNNQPGCEDTAGDYVYDTPAEYGPAGGCPVGRNTCPSAGNDPIENHMDYSDDTCRFQFTFGQVQRFRAALGQWRGITF